MRGLAPTQVPHDGQRDDPSGPAFRQQPDQWFTVVFPGNVGEYAGNPFLADTPFGRAHTIERGDALTRRDDLEDALNDALCALQLVMLSTEWSCMEADTQDAVLAAIAKGAP